MKRLTVSTSITECRESSCFLRRQNKEKYERESLGFVFKQINKQSSYCISYHQQCYFSFKVLEIYLASYRPKITFFDFFFIVLNFMFLKPPKQFLKIPKSKSVNLPLLPSYVH